MGKIIDGKGIAAELRRRLKEEIAQLAERGITPGLATVLVGEDPASQVYVRMKERACEEVGISSRDLHLPASVRQGELIERIEELNRDPAIHGISVPFTLPHHLDLQAIALSIAPQKDIDCIHPENLGRLLAGGAASSTYTALRAREGIFLPATSRAVMELLLAHGVDLKGKVAVVVGGGMVGLPLAVLLLREGLSTVTVCDRYTQDLGMVTHKADILVVAVGAPHLIKGEMIKPGAVVIDVGINHADGELIGDVDFRSAREVASLITPVPGGVGPMTITMLLANTVKAAKVFAGLDLD